MRKEQDTVALWVARRILPHEGKIRSWLTRQWRGAIDVDDVIQEAYCRLSALTAVDHIENPVAYFRKTAYAAAVDAFRRSVHGNVTYLTEDVRDDAMDEEPLADRRAESAQELARVNALLNEMPATYRRVIEMRRIEGLSQRETARRLGVSESIVENSIVRGIRKLLEGMAEQEARAPESPAPLHRPRGARRVD